LPDCSVSSSRARADRERVALSFASIAARRCGWRA
jgi:hypothetical protein